MADSDSSSENATSASGFSYFEEAIGGDEPVNEVELFCCIQSWRFGPSGRAVETQEREKEDIEISNLRSADVSFIARNGECREALDAFLPATLAFNPLILSSLNVFALIFFKHLK